MLIADPDAGTVTAEYDDGFSVTLSDPFLYEDGAVSWTSPSGALEDVRWSESTQATVASTTIALDSAYLANGGSMYVVIVTAPAGLDYLPDPDYVGPDGIARAADGWVRPATIPAGSTGKAVFVNPDAGFGGALTFDGVWIGDDPHQITLAVR